MVSVMLIIEAQGTVRLTELSHHHDNFLLGFDRIPLDSIIFRGTVLTSLSLSV